MEKYRKAFFQIKELLESNESRHSVIFLLGIRKDTYSQAIS
jgi:hypothetical protein